MDTNHVRPVVGLNQVVLLLPGKNQLKGKISSVLLLGGKIPNYRSLHIFVGKNMRCPQTSPNSHFLDRPNTKGKNEEKTKKGIHLGTVSPRIHYCGMTYNAPSSLGLLIGRVRYKSDN